MPSSPFYGAKTHMPFNVHSYWQRQELVQEENLHTWGEVTI